MEMQFSMDRTLMTKYALIIYGYERTGYEEVRSIDHYIVKHRIDEQGRFLEGAPLTRDALQKICSLVMPSLKTPEYLSEKVLACCPGVILWWAPGAPRRIFFTKETGLRSGVYPLPATLFLVADRTLYAWALSVTERPAPSTPIHHSPLFNVYEDGRCCMGNINLPGNASPENINSWEEAYF
jgi:PRTRC genetic system protein B